MAEEGNQLLTYRANVLDDQARSPQYDLFKQWTAVKRSVLEDRLSDRFILFGEWLYARHSVHYRQLPHYFFEFDIYDKEGEDFLSLERRLALLEGTGIHTVPVLHVGALDREKLGNLIGPSRFDSEFENSVTNRIDHLMEGLYLRTEAQDVVTGRAKIVRSEFVGKVKHSEHWQYQTMTVNRLREGADIWS